MVNVTKNKGSQPGWNSPPGGNCVLFVYINCVFPPTRGEFVYVIQFSLPIVKSLVALLNVLM